MSSIDEILRRIAYWNGYDSAGEWDRTGHEAKALIEHYIANQVREARIDEIKRYREAMTFAHITPSIYASERIPELLSEEQL